MQLPEAGASSRKRIKDLRRQLALKARFYGKPEQAEFWLGERGHTETWARLALMAILKRSVIWKKRPQQLSGAGARFGAIRRPVVSGTGVCGFASIRIKLSHRPANFRSTRLYLLDYLV